MEFSRELFERQRHPRCGNANPERMRVAFWEWMIRGDERTPLLAEGHFCYGPYHVRTHFGAPIDDGKGPVWTFDRMGQTRTKLPDGRTVCIGGEHEDFYDPDFYIYNDVVVVGPRGDIELYGYPKEVFPPTDFHSATLVGEQLILVGGVGYQGERQFGRTPVFSLDLTTYRMSAVEACGEMPGWISSHEAEVNADGTITVRGGSVLEEKASVERIRRNFEDYALDARSGVWRRLTNRNWRQFEIRDADRKTFMVGERAFFDWIASDGSEELANMHDLFAYVTFEAIFPEGANFEKNAEAHWRTARLTVDDIPVDVEVEGQGIQIIIQGNLGEERARRLADDIGRRTEACTNGRCVVEQLS